MPPSIIYYRVEQNDCTPTGVTAATRETNREEQRIRGDKEVRWVLNAPVFQHVARQQVEPQTQHRLSDGINIRMQSGAWMTIESGIGFPAVAPHSSFGVAPFLAVVVRSIRFLTPTIPLIESDTSKSMSRRVRSDESATDLQAMQSATVKLFRHSSADRAELLEA